MTLPAVTGPYTSVHCRLSLLRSSIRTTPALKDGEYARQDEDDRFVDYTGAIESIVTSTGDNDGGMFETNLRDERYLPFEGQGAIGRWQIELPTPYRSWDYDSLSDVVLHVRYTAREGGGTVAEGATGVIEDVLSDDTQAPLTRVLGLRRDFPTQWQAFAGGDEDFQATLTMAYFPFIAQSHDVQVTDLELIAADGEDFVTLTLPGLTADDATTALAGDGAQLSVPEDAKVMIRDAGRDVFLRIEYGLST